MKLRQHFRDYFKKQEIKHLNFQMNQVLYIIKNELDTRKIKYRNWIEGEKRLQVQYATKENRIIRLDVSTIEENLVFMATLFDEFPIEKTRELMMIGSQLNSLLKRGIVRINTRENWIFFELSVPLQRYFHRQEMIMENYADVLSLADEIQELLAEQIVSSEDPIFNFASFINQKNIR